MKQLKINRRIGKIIYLLLFLVISAAFLINNGLEDLPMMSSLGFPYWIVFLLVLLALLYQALFNNRIGWVIIVFLIIVHLFLTVRNSINNESSSNLLILIPFYLLAFFLLLLLYPRYRINN